MRKTSDLKAIIETVTKDPETINRFTNWLNLHKIRIAHPEHNGTLLETSGGRTKWSVEELFEQYSIVHERQPEFERGIDFTDKSTHF